MRRNAINTLKIKLYLEVNFPGNVSLAKKTLTLFKTARTLNINRK